MVKNITITEFSRFSLLKPFLYEEEWKHLAEISRELKIPHPTMRIYLNNLEKKGILIKSKKGRLTLYKLNYNNPFISNYLVVCEKERLISACEGNLLLKEITSFLQSLNNKDILIFGSAAVNLKEANDIDLIISENIDKKGISDFESKFKIKFHIINFNNLKELSDVLKKEIIKKHLIIKNSEYFVKWMLEK